MRSVHVHWLQVSGIVVASHGAAVGAAVVGTAVGAAVGVAVGVEMAMLGVCKDVRPRGKKNKVAAGLSDNVLVSLLLYAVAIWTLPD